MTPLITACIAASLVLNCPCKITDSHGVTMTIATGTFVQPCEKAEPPTVDVPTELDDNKNDKD